VASGEEKLTLQFSLSGELKKLVANMSTGTENMAKSSGEPFSALVIFTTELLIEEANDRSI
jgi:hypothetical protein